MALEYEYYCDCNGRSISVAHGMNEELRTWGELCARSGEALGDTDPQAKVSRLIFGGTLALPRRVSKEELPKSDYDPILHGEGGCACSSKADCKHK